MIAEYWSDSPNSEQPPGHWALFAQFVSQRDHHTLDEDVKMFFALSNAIFDAGIAAWDTKRAYDSVRPITAISLLYKGKTIRAWGGPGKGTIEINGSYWLPYQPATFPTPPFPDYVSGHSTYSAAAARILQLWTGSDRFGDSVTVPAGSSKIEPGITPAHPVTYAGKRSPTPPTRRASPAATAAFTSAPPTAPDVCSATLLHLKPGRKPRVTSREKHGSIHPCQARSK